MSHTVVNLKQVQDSSPQLGEDLDFEARFARGALELEKSGVSYFRYGPGVRSPFGHTHEVQEEVYVLVSGSARARVDDEFVELRPWDALRVPPNTMRRFEAGPEGAEIVAFGAPQPESQDARIDPAWWPE